MKHLLLFFVLMEIKKDLNIDHLMLLPFVVEQLYLMLLVLQDQLKFVGLVQHNLMLLHLDYIIDQLLIVFDLMLVVLVHKVLLVLFVFHLLNLLLPDVGTPEDQQLPADRAASLDCEPFVHRSSTGSAPWGWLPVDL